MNRKARILIVDDDSNLRKTLADILGAKGFVPMDVAKGKTALKRVKENPPNVALIDLKLEDMSGLELMEEIKTLSPSTECIVITGFADLQNAIEAVNAGALGYLTKPIEIEELLIKIKAARRKQGNAEREEFLKEKYWKQAVTDGLTEIYNRRYFNEQLLQEVAISDRYDRHFALLMLDIDDFKPYNDTYGHPEGDHAFQRIASLLKFSARETDLVARYGGEEFALILRETKKEKALLIAERLRCLIENAYSEGEKSILRERLTVSIGIANYPTGGTNAKELVAQADEALYAAKASGKNKSCLYDGVVSRGNTLKDALK